MVQLFHEYEYEYNINMSAILAIDFFKEGSQSEYLCESGKMTIHAPVMDADLSQLGIEQMQLIKQRICDEPGMEVEFVKYIPASSGIWCSDPMSAHWSVNDPVAILSSQTNIKFIFKKACGTNYTSSIVRYMEKNGKFMHAITVSGSHYKFIDGN